ncbi:hypothetical protein F4556_005478 [Kitasatospora gansuensis]|uniref:Uncharacterized protein n=1 Tax=Kitasatospora gansuensis TaxID=258050 RepID=A0A7W7SHE4_9ACTN|nr:hypothetical protein [Kitasatospora gansuensis]MBB4949943.1 hypothetical protein [Kitasatospora gansuensis]
MLSRRAALLLAAAGLVQLSPPPARPVRVPPVAPATPAGAEAVPVRPRIEALLADRARALLRLDRTALVAGVAPAHRAAELTVLTRLAQLPLAELSYRITDFTEPAGAALTLTAELGWRVADFDDHPAVLTRRIGCELVDGEWLLTTDQPVGAAALWDLGEVRAVRGGHSIALGQAEPAVLAETVATADRAVPLVTEVWGGDWPGRLLLCHPATGEQFAQLLGVSAAGYQGIAAVTTAAAGAPLHSPADRVLINPQAYAGLSELGRRVVTVHEATHVATRADTRPWTPLWLSEGVADYTGYRGTGRSPKQIAPELARAAAAQGFTAALPADADFAAGSAGIGLAYELAWSACDLIARRFGEQRLVGFYRAVGATEPAGGREEWLDGLCRARLGLGLADLTRQWGEDLHQRYAH